MATRAITGIGAVLGREIIGETIEGGFRLAAAGIQATGNIVSGALSGAGAALGGALQGAMTPAPTTVINNVGVAGTAAKAKVSGGGNLPAPRKSAKPAVNKNMPSEKLLVIAVNYLSSIDKTLQDQLKFESLSLQQQAQAEKENAIESNKGPGVFSKLGQKFGALKDKAADSKAASIAKKLIMGAGIAAIAGLAVGLSTDEQRLEEFKQNWNAFKKEYAWLIELGKYLGAAAVGGAVGGIPGALGSIVLTYLQERGFFNNIPLLKHVLGNDNADAEGGSTSPPTAMGGAITAGMAGYAGYRGVRTARDIASRRASMAAIRARPIVAPSASGVTAMFRDPRTGRLVGPKAAAEAGSWLSGPKGQSFVRFLGKRFGRSWVARKLMPLLARVLAGIAVTATGIGAIPGALWTLVNIGLSIWTVYDLVTALWDWWHEEEAADAEATRPQTSQTSPNAVPAVPSTGIQSASDTGNPEQAQAFFEGKGWTKEQAAGIVSNLWTESRLNPDIYGDGGKAYGIAQWHPDRQQKFRDVYGKDIKGSSFQEQLEFVNWELNNTERAAGNRLRNARSAGDAAAIVDQYYERSSGAARQERVSNAESILGGNYGGLNGGGSGSGQTASNLAGSAFSASMAGLGKIAKVLTGGDTRSFVPMSQQTTDAGARIAQSSARIENLTTFGVNNNNKTTSEMSKLQRALSTASPSASIEVVDPNYTGKGEIINYLQYHKLAAPRKMDAYAGARA